MDDGRGGCGKSVEVGRKGERREKKRRKVKGRRTEEERIAEKGLGGREDRNTVRDGEK